jgi:sulfate permease, SulP family
LWQARGGINPEAVTVSLATVLIILGLRKWMLGWPSFLIAIAGAAALTWAFDFDVVTIASRFGELPRSLSQPGLQPFSLAKAQAVLPDAAAITLLGAIESLFSAVVADGMSGRRHRANCELVTQGTANIGSILFGGIPVTGTIARTATNIRAGAVGPISGMLHSLFLFLFMLVAAPLAGFLPLAALGAVLAVVAWNMAEREDFILLLRSSRGDRIRSADDFLADRIRRPDHWNRGRRGPRRVRLPSPHG